MAKKTVDSNAPLPEEINTAIDIPDALTFVGNNSDIKAQTVAPGAIAKNTIKPNNSAVIKPALNADGIIKR